LMMHCATRSCRRRYCCWWCCLLRAKSVLSAIKPTMRMKRQEYKLYLALLNLH
jgi:hypothetical protein